MKHALNITTSLLASTYRFWRGTMASKTVKQPEGSLLLFDQEGNADCRLVREVLTELNLDVVIRPCPADGKNIKELHAKFDKVTLPILIDINHSVAANGAKEVIDHLFSQYKGTNPPRSLITKLSNNLTSQLATGIRLGAGRKARPARQAEQPLILYSFESSPYTRPVRERLCELELTYILINLGKQQVSDMGPATFRWSVKPYRPLPNTKRDDFFKLHGNVQIPYLMDPNTNIDMFESKDILRYLERTYAIHNIEDCQLLANNLG
ncbi:glutathione S-transferase N-terminal domain-containing protein [Photobacterium minamisatsumaniensis]|uniref:glutathione S-transferase N-terminal domain-containing protein n=1 Tax=Photobacterium minamisatsumaniensis TaxID=2910233 RepID=UPI003D0E5FEE